MNSDRKHTIQFGGAFSEKDVILCVTSDGESITISSMHDGELFHEITFNPDITIDYHEGMFSFATGMTRILTHCTTEMLQAELKMRDL
jgi:hypothetical protein